MLEVIELKPCPGLQASAGGPAKSWQWNWMETAPSDSSFPRVSVTFDRHLARPSFSAAHYSTGLIRWAAATGSCE